MRKQRGQSAVEFALMAPIIFMMIFGMIYGGIMFIEYMHYSNAVRTAARQIAVINNTTQRESMRQTQKNWLKKLWTEEVSVKLYEPDPEITIVSNYDDTTNPTTETSKDVIVNVTFVRSDDIPVILYMLDFPPKYIKTIQYRMRVEERPEETQVSTTDTSTTTTTQTGTGG